MLRHNRPAHLNIILDSYQQGGIRLADGTIRPPTPIRQLGDHLSPTPSPGMPQSPMSLSSASYTQTTTVLGLETEILQPIFAVAPDSPGERLDSSTTTQVGPSKGRSEYRVICQDLIEVHDKTTIHNDCGTCFHQDCMADLVARDGKCPLCRKEIEKLLTSDQKWTRFTDFFTQRLNTQTEISQTGSDEEKMAHRDKPGYSAQESFRKACVEAKKKLRSTEASIDKDYEEGEELARTEYEVKCRRYKRYAQEATDEAVLQFRRQLMQGVHWEVAKDQAYNEKLNIKTVLREGWCAGLREYYDKEEELEEDFYDACDKAQHLFEDTVGYHWFVMQNLREACARSEEWEDVPMPV